LEVKNKAKTEFDTEKDKIIKEIKEDKYKEYAFANYTYSAEATTPQSDYQTKILEPMSKLFESEINNA